MLWLDVIKPQLASSRWIELGQVFTLVWPASRLLMAGANSKPLSLGYFVLLAMAITGNVVVFSLVGVLTGIVVLAGKRIWRALYAS